MKFLREDYMNKSVPEMLNFFKGSDCMQSQWFIKPSSIRGRNSEAPQPGIVKLNVDGCPHHHDAGAGFMVRVIFKILMLPGSIPLRFVSASFFFFPSVGSWDSRFLNAPKLDFVTIVSW